MTDLGPLVPADETFFHQITDTFATVGQSDRSWTEKVWAMAGARDGSLQLAFGLGRYPNRNVVDAAAGASRGVEQWTVRASRALSSDPGDTTVTAVGPIRYEVVEPLREVRFTLEANDEAPLQFEWTFRAAAPAILEQRERHRSEDGFRLDADIVRYHQAGTATGWVELEGRRVQLDDTAWVSTRDHSWGVRYSVGAPIPDVRPPRDRAGVASLVMWCPLLFERPDGSRYGMHWYYQRHRSGTFERVELQGGIEHPDGRREALAALVPDLHFDDATRRLLGGTVEVTLGRSGRRTLTVQPVSDTGFHLGGALYFGLDDHWHGQWRGPLHVEGEYVPDCTDPAAARRLHQMRDCLVRVEDPVAGAVGWGNLESLAIGADPDMGLTEEASFV